MRKKHLKRIVALGCSSLMVGGTVFGVTACKPKVSDTPETLEIFIAELGYGAAWCEAMTQAFAQEDWVKAKYPNLNIILEVDGDRSVINTRLEAGEGYNTVDLVMSDSITAMGQDKSGVEYSCDLTDVVYKTTVPGESGTVYDKLLDPYKKSLQWYGYGDSALETQDFKSYDFNWATGMQGIVYNEELLEECGFDAPPRTSDEWIEQMDVITAKKGYSIMWSSEANYLHYLFNIWWGQYEGYNNYYNYYNGLYFDGEFYIEKSNKVFEQKGRYEALDAMSKIMHVKQGGYMYEYGGSVKFKAAQKNFINGEASVFMANGDYMSDENAADTAASNYTIRMMKTPIISAITDTTETIKDDATLRTVVSRIDDGYATVDAAKKAPTKEGDADISNVSEDDYKKIIAARAITDSVGSSHHTCIPVYAAGKQVAFDFLRFMATDKAQEIYMKATKGATLPFKYDINAFKEREPEIYNSFYDMQKDRLSYAYASVEGQNLLPATSTFPLVKYGGLSRFTTYGLDSGSILSFPMSGKDAYQAWLRDIEYWQADNGQRWQDVIRKAGLN